MQGKEQSKQYADQYTLHLILGEGGQASVYLASLNNQFFAIKVFFPGASKEEACKSEADFLKKVNFKHLINMVDYRPFAKVKLNGKPQQKKPVIILEFAEGGDLFEYISKQGPFSPEVSRTYIKQLLSAIQYLVNQGITHRDLKPENILFDRDFNLRISDFGLSRDAHGDKGDYKLKSKVGTQGYKPPEMYQGTYTGFQTDIFAAGVILFVMYSGTPPFLSSRKQDRIYRLIRQKNFTQFWAVHENQKPPGFYPIEFKRLINSFLSAEIDRRPTFLDIQKDQWLNGDEIMMGDLSIYARQGRQDYTKRYKQAKDSVNQKGYLSQQKYQNNNLVKQEGECEIQQQSFGSRGEAQIQGQESMSEEQIFAKDYREIIIDSKDLSQYTKNKVVYVKENASFVVAWIKNFLDAQFKSHQIFIQNFVSEIVPISYNASYLAEKHEIKVQMRFQIDEDDETELIIVGKLHRSEKGQIGIEWQKVTGNSYWLSTVQTAINSSLQTLAV